MATDATGTPTTNTSIPKFDTAVDAPSGLGFNAAMDHIDGIIIPDTLIDAKGDLIAGSAADTAARLAVGTDGYVLTAASGQTTGLEWAAPAGGGATYLPIELRNPQAASNAGNCFPAVTSLTDWEYWHWEFLKDVDGKLFGLFRIPEDATVSVQQIILEIAANATSGVTRMNVAAKNAADGVTINPGALTASTSQDVTVPATARLRKKLSFTIGTDTWAAGDLVIVEVYHEGAHANDTVAVNTELIGAWARIA